MNTPVHGLLLNGNFSKLPYKNYNAYPNADTPHQMRHIANILNTAELDLDCIMIIIIVLFPCVSIPLESAES